MDIAAILFKKYPDAEWNLNGDSYSGLDWISKTSKPTESQLSDLWAEVLIELKAEKQAKIDAETSAVSKLSALGLTAEEISALRK